METATLVAIFISGLLVSFTGYALPFEAVHAFVSDRLRSIRQDLSMQEYIMIK